MIQKIIIGNILFLLSVTGLTAQLNMLPFYPEICEGESISLSCTPSDPSTIPSVFAWTPTTGLSQTNSQVVVASPTVTTTYTCVTDIGMASITVVVSPDPSASVSMSGINQSSYCTTDGILNLTGTPTNANGYFSFSEVPSSPGGGGATNLLMGELMDNCDGTATLDLSQITPPFSPTLYEVSYTYYEGGDPWQGTQYQTLTESSTLLTFNVNTTPGETYILSLYDSYGDGITNGGMKIEECQNGNFVTLFDNIGSFPGNSAQHQFTAVDCSVNPLPPNCPSVIGGGFIQLTVMTDNFPNETGWDIVNVSQVAGCGTTVTNIINVFAGTPGDISGLAPTYCSSDDPVDIIADPSGGTLTVNPDVPGALTPNGEIDTFDPGAYPDGETVTLTYEYTNGNGCTSITTATTTISPEPDITFTGLETTYCTNDDPDVFNVSPSGGTLTIDPDTPGTLTFDGTDYTFNPSFFLTGETVTFTYTVNTSGNCESTEIFVTTIHPTPNVNFFGLDLNYCTSSDDITLFGNPLNGTFATNAPAGFTDNGDGTGAIDFSEIPPGTYDMSYDFTDANGCTGYSGIVAFTVDALPPNVLSIEPENMDICAGETVILYANWDETTCAAPDESLSANNYIWTGGTTTPTQFRSSMVSVNPTTTTTYTVTANGQSASVTINVIPDPILDIENLNDSYCVEENAFTVNGNIGQGSFSISPDPGSGFTNNGDGTAEIQPFAMNPNTYNLTYTVAEPAIVYEYAFGQANTNFTETITVQENGMYDLFIYDAFGDGFTNGGGSIDIFLCGTLVESFVQDSGNPGFSFQPFLIDVPLGCNLLEIAVTTDDFPTDLAMTLQDINASCGGTVTETFTINELPTVSISTDSEEYCTNDDPFLITVSPPGGTLTLLPDLSGGITPSGDNFLFDPSFAQSGADLLFIYDYTDANGCLNTNSTRALIFIAPSVSFTGLPANICENDSPITLTGDPAGGVFVTNAPAGLNGNVLDPSQVPVGQSFFIEYSFMSPNGCEDFQTQTFIVEESTAALITGLESEYCADNNPIAISVNPLGGTLTLSPDVAGALTVNGDDYLFNPSAYPNGATVTFTYIPNNGACISTTTDMTTIHPVPTVSILGLNAAYCINESGFTITGTPFTSADNFSTNLLNGFTDNGDGTAFIEPSLIPAGTYEITYTHLSNDGCENDITELFTINDLPDGTFTGLTATYLNNNTAVTITATLSGGTFTSSEPTGFTNNGDGTATLDPMTMPVGGPYDITYSITDANGCNNSSTQQVTIVSAAEIVFTGLSPIYCEDDNSTITLTGNPTDANGIFTSNLPNGFTDNGDGTATLILNNLPTDTEFEITYTYDFGNGQTGEDTQTFEISSLPEITFAPIDAFHCEGAPDFTITATPNTGTFSTNAPDGLTDNGNGEATFSPSFSGTGTFTIYYTALNDNDCENTDSIMVEIGTNPMVTIDNFSAQICANDAPITLMGTPAGGVFSTNAPSGLTGNVLDPSQVPQDQGFFLNYAFTDANGCEGFASESFTVSPAPDATFTGLASEYCAEENLVTLTVTEFFGTMTADPDVAGAITPDGTNFIFNPSVYPNGETVTITYTVMDEVCDDTFNQTTIISPSPTAAISGLNAAYCADEAAFTITGNPTSPAGIFMSNIPNGFTDNGDGTATVDPTMVNTGINFEVTYTFTDGNNCEGIATENFTVNELPAVSFTGLAPNYISSAPPVTLMGTPINGTFSFSAPTGLTDNGDGTATLDPAATAVGGPYNVIYTFTDANGCSNTAVQQVSIVNQLVVSFGGLGDEYCADADLVQLTGSPTNENGIFTTTATGGLVDNGNGTATLDVSLVPTGQEFSITYTYTDPDNGQMDDATQTFIVNELPTVNIDNLATTYCSDESAITINGTPTDGLDMVFSSTAANGFVDNGDGTASFDPSAAGIGVYDITYLFTSNESCINSITQSVEVVELPNANFTNLATSYFDNDPIVNLTATLAGGIFSSSQPTGFTDNGDGTASLEPMTMPLGGPYEITYSITDTNGCENVSTQEVTILAAAQVTFTGLSPTYCEGDNSTIVLTGNPTDANGIFTSNLPNGLTDNGDGTATLDLTGLPIDTEFEITYTYDFGNGQTGEDAQIFEITPLPNADFTNLATSYFDNDPIVNLTATLAGGIFSSSQPTGFTDNGDGTANLDPMTMPVGGPYNITYSITDANGCENVSTQEVTILAAAQVTFTGLSPTYCEGDNSTVILTGNPTDANGVFTSNLPNGLTDNGDGTATLDLTGLPIDTEFEITYTYDFGNGQTGEDAQIFEIGAPPPVTFTPLDASYCSNDWILSLEGSILPTGTNTATFTYNVAGSPGLIDNGDGTASINLSQVPADIPLEITYELVAGECISSFSQTIQVTETPDVTFTELEAEYCPNGIIEISGSPLPVPPNANAVFQINFPTGFTDNGDGTATLDLSQVPQGQNLTITLSYLYANNCFETAFQSFTVPALPEVSFTELDEIICGETELIALEGNPLPGSNTEGIFSSNIPNDLGLTDNGDGTATLDPLTVPNDDFFEIYYTYIDANSCIKMDTQTVAFGSGENLFFTGMEEDLVCNDNEQLILIPSNTDPGEWSTIPTGLVVVENDTAFLPLAGIADGTEVIVNYSLTNGGVCSQNASDTIVVLAAPELDLPDTLIFCGASLYTLENLNPDDEILWSTGETTAEIMIDSSGTYSVEVLSSNGCFVSDTMTVLVETDLAFLSNFLVAQAACVGDTIHFIDISNVQIQADAYNWDFGDGTTSTERDPTHIYTDAGSYEVRFEAIAAGCDTIEIVKNIQISVCRLLPGVSIFNEVTIAPNPNDGNFYVEVALQDKQPIIITVFDIQGRKFTEERLDFKPYYKVDFDNLPNGVYTVQVQSLRERMVLKMVVF